MSEVLLDQFPGLGLEKLAAFRFPPFRTLLLEPTHKAVKKKEQEVRVSERSTEGLFDCLLLCKASHKAGPAQGKRKWIAFCREELRSCLEKCGCSLVAIFCNSLLPVNLLKFVDNSGQ